MIFSMVVVESSTTHKTFQFHMFSFSGDIGSSTATDFAPSDFFFISIKRLHYEFTTYTTLQDYYTIQLYNTTGNDTPRRKRL